MAKTAPRIVVNVKESNVLFQPIHNGSNGAQTETSVN